ncbi:MAG: hypothetical protein L0099_14895 [Acidobacteria bacterium]|nr:hypothetical protein [Acidobacteriota bacterium]
MSHSTLIRLSLFIGCISTVGCADVTATASLPVHGATYELVALDGRGAPFEYQAPGRFGMIRAVAARIELRFEMPDSTYAFVQYADFNTPYASTFRSTYRQSASGTVRLIGTGTFDDGINREFVEGQGVPRANQLRLRTTASFVYGAHIWDFQLK